MTPINIVADENILLLDEFFSDIATVTKVNPRTLTAQQVAHADALVLRSTAKVTPEILAHSKVQFVGTCTIGTDHLAIDYMQTQGVEWRNAPGCNAAGVGDYVVACINHAWQHLNIDPQEHTIGIVGAGNVGGRLEQRLTAAGFKVILCDPPKFQEGNSSIDTPTNAVTVDELIAQCSIICLHAPLTVAGSHATSNLLSADRIHALKAGTVLISAGRGEVVDQQALLQRQQQKADLNLYLDVWHNEPNIDPALFEYCHCVTPHIAGHSLEGKMRGTYMIYKELCSHFGLEARLTLDQLMPAATLQHLTLEPQLNLKQTLNTVCNSVYDIMQDDAALRAEQDFDHSFGQSFDHLRKNYPVRREFSSLTVHGITDKHTQKVIAALGFNCDF